LLRHHLLDGLDLRQRRCHQPAKVSQPSIT
jgi:hypothetical protein